MTMPALTGSLGITLFLSSGHYDQSEMLPKRAVWQNVAGTWMGRLECTTLNFWPLWHVMAEQLEGKDRGRLWASDKLLNCHIAAA